ncbi:hypothetical protein [Variovorax terrae]|uniref:Intradiol ring-cleavage dioxygenase n=1 Tax=Variovorax terrae TaxID=2923278 RepID=A0A9X1VQN3_9BURK|nr:hypothetical protein [Variovorax terrae]MCJ0761619.1 hypothetical protein [Variovorax terrae]
MYKKIENKRAQEVIDMSRRNGLVRLSAFASSLMVRGALTSAAWGIAASGASSSALAGSCILSPDGRTGPFYTALNLVRSDLREDRTGVVLDIDLAVQNSACSPLVGAAVAIWNCDSRGMYSEYPNVNPDVPGYAPVPLGQVPSEAPHYPEQDLSQKFLRGVQVTDERGFVRFRVIYPSWYATRTPHIHVKVYPGAAVGDTTAYTGQLYFPEAINTTVLSNPLYTGRTQPRDTLNNTDRHYVAMGGLQNELQISSVVTGLQARKTLVVPV